MHKLDPHRAAAGRLALSSDAGAAPQRARSYKALLQLLGWRLPAAGRCLSAVYLPQPDLPVVSPRRAAATTKAGTGHSQPEGTSPLRGLRQGLPHPLRPGEILPGLRGQSPPQTEGGIRPETPVRRRQIRPRKASNTNASRTAVPAGQYDFPRTQRKQVLSVYIDAKKGVPS